MSNICITGIGLVSCLGIGEEENFSQLKAQQTGIAQKNLLNTTAFVGALNKSNTQLKELCGISTSETVSRTALLGILAAREAFETANKKQPAAFINGSTVGGMDLSEKYFDNAYQNKPANAALLSQHDLGTVTNYIAQHTGNFGYTNTISTACSSAANAILIGAQLIKSGMYKQVLVGGTDALCEFTIQGFRSLMVYSNQWCQPFDTNRSGLNLGEGAAYLLLESESDAKANNKKIYGYLRGAANANDAYHATGTSPNGVGAQKAMTEALQQANILPTQVDYINAHGTATENNDSSELAAMQAIFADSLPPFSSTKAYTGHTLATAGAIEACISLHCLNQQYIFPNLNVQNSMAPNQLVTEGRTTKLRYILSNSFGFGGNCTSLLFEKPHE